jgi:hypothetical protein
VTRKHKRFTIIGGLVVLLVVAGIIVAVVTPSSKETPGGYPLAVQQAFLSGCEGGKAAPNPSLCHCLLAKTEANYSVAELKRIEDAQKRGAPPPSRFTQLSLECYAPETVP